MADLAESCCCVLADLAASSWCCPFLAALAFREEELLAVVGWELLEDKVLGSLVVVVVGIGVFVVVGGAVGGGGGATGQKSLEAGWILSYHK